MKDKGQNHALRLKTLEESIQVSPPLQQRLQQDQVFQALVAARVKHHRHQLDQEQNKQIGRMGASPVLGQ